MASYLSLLALFVGVSMVAGGGYGAKSYQHYGHYHYAKTTCADHYTPGCKNGYYKVYSVKYMGSMKVYCDFESEPGMAYTMVVSSSVDGRLGANVIIGPAVTNLANPFQDVSLAAPETSTIKHDVNGHIPNKFAYRQSRADMERISKASKVWRMTCGTKDDVFTSYARGKVSVVNPVTLTTTNSPNCVDVEYVNMGSNSCAHCQVSVEQMVSGSDNFFHVGDSSTCTSAISGTLVTRECPSGTAALWFGKPVH